MFEDFVSRLGFSHGIVLGSVAGSTLVLIWVYSHKECFSSGTTCPTIFICPSKVCDYAEELEEKARESLDDAVDKTKDAADEAKEGFKEAFDKTKEVANSAKDNVEELAGKAKEGVEKVIKAKEGKKVKGKKNQG